MTMKQILAGAALLLLTTSALAQGAPKAPTVGGKRLVHVKPIAPTGCKLVGTVKGTRDRLSIDRGTESMPELGPGTKRRASVMRAPPWSAVLWAAPSRAGPRHSRTGLRSPSRQ